ncbi:uroporphyrinogen-III C-methyltransferase [Diaphorobacter limosus]|uniref:Uroporphyrinogen-III C-methyltransferase n=1 Tax=Diaphorobacter limosus TaxID=3036128 RepID=A0ABZ0J791_9BURK|nr:uroporphyrinogen-III C-methyltransferase [Diaphorobacter sp. Y-1]WOO32703.1 uroporphyrinogen-III C-methyltransferase [Diaphorobacter sp. Y-1]
MSTESAPEPSIAAAAAPQPAPTMGHSGGVALYALAILTIAALVSSVLLWQRVTNMQEQLARQSADSGTQAVEARTIAQQAQDVARETSARLAVTEARVGEVALQRGQLEELMQSLSRSRDENLVVDIDAGLRLAQQQAQLTGSLQPLVAALKSASQRIERAAQPRLAPVLRAMGHDLERLEHASVTDTAGLLVRIDDLVRQVDDLPLINQVAQAAVMRRQAESAPTPAAAASSASESPWQSTLRRAWEGVRDETRGLVRVSRVDHPEAMLIAPDQAFFLRENLKLKLLNARLGLLARRMDSARADVAATINALNKYFDPASRRTQGAATALQQLQSHMKTAELPQLDDSFAALATAAAGR